MAPLFHISYGIFSWHPLGFSVPFNLRRQSAFIGGMLQAILAMQLVQQNQDKYRVQDRQLYRLLRISVGAGSPCNRGDARCLYKDAKTSLMIWLPHRASWKS